MLDSLGLNILQVLVLGNDFDDYILDLYQFENLQH